MDTKSCVPSSSNFNAATFANMRVSERHMGKSMDSCSTAVALEVYDKLANVMDYQTVRGSIIDVLGRHQRIVKIYAGRSEFWAKIITMVDSMTFHRRAYGATMGPGSPSMAETHGKGMELQNSM